MEMDKTFQQLKTQVIGLCHVASSISCEKVFIEFEDTTLKGLFLGSRAWEGNGEWHFSCKRSFEEKDNKKRNEHYVDTLSIDMLCNENMNGKNEDACATSIEVNIIPDKNVDILPLQIKRTIKDNGKVYTIKRKYFHYNYLTTT